MAAVIPAGPTGPRTIAGSGTPEHAWQSWPGLHALPSSSLAACLPSAGRLVVLAPHPDDEVLACGGLLAMHAAQGGASLVIAATDGEASHAGVAGWSPATLAAARRAESLQGLAVLAPGGCEVLRLGLPDGALGAHAGQIEQPLQAVLQPGDLLVTTWRSDGHPDHEACGRAALLASLAVGCRLAEAPVWMWHWAAPGTANVPWHRLHALPLTADALQRKAAALAAHATQLVPRPGSDDGRAVGGPVLDAGVLSRARRAAEYFFF